MLKAYVSALIIVTLAVVATQSQPLQVNLQLSPNPSPYLSDWQTRTETAFLSVTNHTTNTLLVRVDGRIYRGGADGEIQANSKVMEMPILEIIPGTAIYNAADIFPGDLVQFHGDVDKQATRAGRIPAGQYTLCVTLVNAENTQQPLSQQKCASFNVQQVLPPQLLHPENSTTTSNNKMSQSVFRWSRETPPVFGSVTEFVVVERYDSQPLWQALSANPPVYQQQVPTGLTQVQWPPDVLLQNGHQYVWSVRVVDIAGMPATEPEWATPYAFNIIEQSYVTSDSIADADQNSTPCSIRILAPEFPCTGSVHNYHSEDAITVLYEVSGNLNDVFITVYENPCGTFDPPYKPEDRTTTTPRGTTRPERTTGPITQGYKAITSFPCTTTSGVGEVSIAVNEYVKPGGAYILGMSGYCTTTEADGSTSISLHEASDVCWRYRPLVEQAPNGSVTDTPSELDRGKTTDVPSGGVPKVPVTEIPCDSIPPSSLVCSPSKSSNPATPIEATLELRDPAVYPYPRATPLRVNAIDFDYAIFQCTGCRGGMAEEYRPVRDGIGDISWTLLGKGSLNTPFDATTLQTIDEEIVALLQKLVHIKDSISITEGNKKKAIDEFHIAKTDAESSLKTLEEDCKQAQDSLDTVMTLLSSTRGTLDSLALKLDSLGQLYGVLQDSVVMHQDSIARLDSLLTNPPSAAETAILVEVESSKKNVERTQNELQALQQVIASTSKQFQDAIKNSDAVLRNAHKAYSNAQNSIGKKTKAVADLQSMQYGTPALRDYQQSQRDVRLQSSTFAASYPTATNLPVIMAAIETMLNQVHTALEVTSLPPRAKAKKVLDSLSAMTAFLLTTSCGAFADHETKVACSSGVDDFAITIARYRDDATVCLLTGQKLKKGIEADIKAAQSAITAMESPLASAAAAVVAAQESHTAALLSYQTTVGTLDVDRKTKLDNVESAKVVHNDAQRRYQTERDLRDSAYRANKTTFLQGRGEFARARDSNRRIVDSLSLLTIQARNDSIATSIILLSLARDSIQLKDSITICKTEIDRLKRFIAQKDEDITKPFDEKLKRLRMDSTDLEKQLEDAKKKHETASAGNKSATGEFAYYIPPPLEMIFDASAKKHFDDLKDSVAKAETNLEVALADKESLQGTLAQTLSTVANTLAEIKVLEKSLADANEGLTDIDGELADMKNELAKEFRGEYDGLSEEVANASSAESVADAAYVAASNDAATYAKQLDSKRDALNNAQSLILPKQDVLRNAIDAYRSRKATVDSETNTLTTKGNELNGNRKDLRAKQRQTKRASDATRRAIAREDVSAEAIGRSKLLSATAAESATNSEIAENKSALISLGTHLNSNVQALAAEDSAVSHALDDWLVVYNKVKLRQREYDDVLTLLTAATQRMERYRGDADRASARKNLAANKQANMDKPDDAVDNSQDIAAKLNEKADLQQQKDEATDQIKSLMKSIKDAVDEKDKLISDADKTINDARNKLADAEKNLKDFITSEFSKPKHRDTLKIVVKDKVVDGWRSGDKPKEFLCFIKYDGTRIPALECGPLSTKAPPVLKFDDNCVPDVSTEVGSSVVASDPIVTQREPRTIALLYKNGRPLWKEWPVFNDGAILAKDVVVVTGEGGDGDLFVHACKPKVHGCIPPPPSKSPVVDLVSRDWTGEGIFRHLEPRSPKVLWQPDEVPKDKCRKPQLTRAEYYANEIHGDLRVKKEPKHPVEPGAIVEVTDSLIGWPDHTDTVVARIVTGDHKGLAGEEIVFIPNLESGRSEDWKLDGATTTITRKTDGDGYVKLPFNFGKGFATWSVNVRWVRGDTCKRDIVKLISPLLLKFHRFGKNAPTIAWNGAVKVWEGAEVDAVLKTMPEVTDDNNPYGKMVHAIAGFLDENRGFVNDETMNFKPIRPAFTTDPKSVTTSLFGIARSQVNEQIDKKTISMKVFPIDTLKPVTRPPEIEKSYNPRGGKKFKIGDPADPFYVEMDQPFDLQETVSGSGKIKLDVPNEFLKAFVDLPITVNDVILTSDTSAAEGTVSYETGALYTKWGAFTFSLTKILIRAQSGCGIEGTVAHSALASPVSFTADLGGKGEFFGEVSNLPSVEAKGFVLKQGASIALDFHSKLPEASPLGPEFKGLIIGQAQLEFPEEFNTKDASIPTTLSVSNLGIGNSGLSGTVSVEGGPLAISFAKFSISVGKLSLTFKENALEEGSIEGAFSLEKPFSGTLLTKLTFSDSWTAEFETKSSISIPRWKAVTAVQPGTRLDWDRAKGIGTFTLVAVIQSDQLGRIEINELTYASDGTFKVKGGVKKDVTIKVLKGFDLKIQKVTIEASNEDFALDIHGSFGIPGIGLDKLTGILHVKPGPEVSVEFTGGTITITKGPFTLEGDFEWKDNAFYADLSVEVTNVFKGITGVIFVGTQPTTDDDSYTFWYVGLTLSTAIPLGQSGLSITSIGGGVGWNCRPPIGNERPTPENFDNIALRASVGIGNTLPPPPGKVFNSEFVMVYAPGSITLGGSAWLMDQRKSISGDGQLNIAWSPKTSVSGFIRASIGIPDNGGKVLLMRGKIDFLFSHPVFKIESEYLDASLLGVLNANAQFKVTPAEGFIKGKVWYDLNTTADIGVGTVKAGINLSANGSLTYATSPSISVSGSLWLKGNAYLSFENSLTSFDLAKAYTSCAAEFTTSSSTFKMSGKVSAYVSVLGFGGNVDFDIGAEV